MLHKIVITASMLLFILLFSIVPVNAAINTISAGNTVFIGEEGLDISGTLGGATQIGWWASGASITTSSPDYIITITNPAGFFISPTEFGSRTGSWYTLPAKTLAFLVADPHLDIRVEDTTVSVDVTDKWVPTDDELRFRIDTNLVAIAQRGAGAPPVTIKVQSPEGGIFTSLVNKAGVPISIVDIPVSTTPFYTDSIWDTGNRALYNFGSYMIWAECNVNRMKDNYGDSGKTISRKSGLLNQDQNPLITPKVPTSSPSPQVTSIPATPAAAITSDSPRTQVTRVLPSISPSVIPTPYPSAGITIKDTPSPLKTKTIGFEVILSVAALIIGLVFYIKKK